MCKLRKESRIATGVHTIYGCLYGEIGFGQAALIIPICLSHSIK
jgi:hypothetical protein